MRDARRQKRAAALQQQHGNEKGGPSRRISLNESPTGCVQAAGRRVGSNKKKRSRCSCRWVRPLSFPAAGPEAPLGPPSCCRLVLFKVSSLSPLSSLHIQPRTRFIVSAHGDEELQCGRLILIQDSSANCLGKTESEEVHQR